MILSREKFVLKNYNAYVVGCSVMGKDKIENQDRVEIRQTRNGLIIVVADGLGSALFSGDGAEKGVKITANLLEENNFDNFASRLLDLWKNGLEGNLDQYDTTIKFIYLTQTKIIVGGVGDGWIALKKKKEIKNYVAKNEFSNQTDSILSSNLNDKFWMEEFKVAGVSSIIIATDGFSEDISKNRGFEFLSQAEKEIKSNISQFAQELDETLTNWPIETNKDDKTAVFVVLSRRQNE